MNPRSSLLLRVLVPSEKDIRRAAYHLWEEAGRPLGRDLEFWFRARERLHRPEPVRILPRPAASTARNAQPVEAGIR
jgi:hypothetical protein